MICYIDRTEVPDVEHIAANVLQYLIARAEQANRRYTKLERYYRGTTIFLMANRSRMKCGWQ